MGDCFAPLGPPLLPWDSMAQTYIHTYIHTYGHGDSQTNSAQWGRVGENIKYTTKLEVPALDPIWRKQFRRSAQSGEDWAELQHCYCQMALSTLVYVMFLIVSTQSNYASHTNIFSHHKGGQCHEALHMPQSNATGRSFCLNLLIERLRSPLGLRGLVVQISD